jgi:hypothetical protein
VVFIKRVKHGPEILNNSTGSAVAVVVNGTLLELRKVQGGIATNKKLEFPRFKEI